MLIDRAYLQEHITSAAIILFVVLYGVFVYLRPAFLYNKDGSLRVFGVGYRKKTVVPMWLLSIVLAIGCYFLALYYVAYPRLWNL